MIDLVINMGAMEWVAIGLAVLLIEVLFSGTGHLVWIGAAALLSALLSWLGLSWIVQWVAFALLSLAGGIGWKVYLRHRPEKVDPADALNNRASLLVGREVHLIESIVDGSGRVKLGDSTWLVTGPELEAGSKVRVVAVKGSVLEVQAS